MAHNVPERCSGGMVLSWAMKWESMRFRKEGLGEWPAVARPQRAVAKSFAFRV
jgi:hypothetical protein